VFFFFPVAKKSPKKKKLKKKSGKKIAAFKEKFNRDALFYPVLGSDKG